jgi:hypothetical protein
MGIWKRKDPHDYQSKLATYDRNGDYFNSSNTDFNDQQIASGRDKTMDKNGIIMVMYSGVYRYNPVIIAQYGLANYGKYFKTGNISNRREFLKYADALVNMQGKDGALRYNFTFTKDYLHVKYYSGWVFGNGTRASFKRIL